MAKLFPTPASIPFDVEEVYTAIENYKGYPSSRIVNRHSPSLVKELRKCGWGIDDKGYMYPLDRSIKIFKTITRLWDSRAKVCLAISLIFASVSPDIKSWGDYLHIVSAMWLISYCTSYCLSKLSVLRELCVDDCSNDDGSWV